MPNRIIKESICESIGLTNCSVFAQELYKRLLTYADDYGRFNADTMIMRARLFPREYEAITEQDIIDALIDIAGNGKISFYTPTGKKGIYGAFPNWAQHERVRDSKKKCPEPDDTSINDWYLRRFISKDMKRAVLERDNMKCAVCGKYLTSCKDIERFLKLGQGLYHIGHIVPVSQGGCDAIENLRLTCPECNLKRKETFAFEAILKETNGSDFPVSPQLAANCGGLRPESNPNPIQSKSESKSMRGAESSSTPSVAELPLNDGTVYAVSVEQCQKWAGLYPAVDVIQQLRAMTGWLDANPTKRKTRHGIERFINAWLAKDQDRGGVRHAADRGRNPIFEVPCGTTGRNKPTLGTVLE